MASKVTPPYITLGSTTSRMPANRRDSVVIRVTTAATRSSLLCSAPVPQNPVPCQSRTAYSHQTAALHRTGCRHLPKPCRPSAASRCYGPSSRRRSILLQPAHTCFDSPNRPPDPHRRTESWRVPGRKSPPAQFSSCYQHHQRSSALGSNLCCRPLTPDCRPPQGLRLLFCRRQCSPSPCLIAAR